MTIDRHAADWPTHRLDDAAVATARALTPVAAVQNRYNLLDRSGVEVLTDCERHGIAFVPYWPLAFGGLTAHEALDGPARRLSATPAQIALAWLLRRSPVMVVIPGTRSVEHLRANAAAARIARELTDDEVATLTGVTDESTATLDRPAPSTTDALDRMREAASG